MCDICGQSSTVKSKCTCKLKKYTSELTYDGPKLFCNSGEINRFTIKSCTNLNDILKTYAEQLCLLWNSAIAIDYISDITLNGTDLEVTGVGNAFNGIVDLQSFKDYIYDVTLTDTDLVFTGVGAAFSGSVDLSTLLSPPNSINIYNSDSSLTSERRATFNGFNIGWIGTEGFGIGVEPNAIGITTVAGGIDSVVQFHVAGPIRTDNWYHGRYGLLLHQTGDVTNTFCGFQVGLNVIPSPANGVWNTAYGYLALREVTTGYANTAVGHSALRRNLTGDKNVAIGENTLSFSTDAQNCIAIGSYALNQSLTASANVAIGNSSQELNIDGVQNVSVGVFTLRENVSGGANVAIGQYALYLSTNTESNTAIGHFSMGEETFSGQYNVAVGRDSLRYSIGDDNVSVGRNNSPYVSGTKNVSLGAYSLGEFTSTLLNENIALGHRAGQKLEASNNNIFIGVSAQGGTAATRTGLTNLILIGSAKSGAAGYNVGADTLTNSISIGNNISNSNQIRIGNITDHATAEVPVAWTVTSDARFKNISVDAVPGLDFINRIIPIKYKLKDLESGENKEDKFRYGFSAQDIIALEGNEIVIGDNSDLDHLKLRESMIVPILVNAIKELNQEIVNLKINNNLL